MYTRRFLVLGLLAAGLLTAQDAPPTVQVTGAVKQALTLSADDLAAHGLYELLRNAGITLKIAKQSIGARIATAAEAHVLGEARRAPLLTMTRSAYDDQGRAIEHGSHIYRASRYSFDITLSG